MSLSIFCEPFAVNGLLLSETLIREELVAVGSKRSFVQRRCRRVYVLARQVKGGGAVLLCEVCLCFSFRKTNMRLADPCEKKADDPSAPPRSCGAAVSG